MLPTLRKGDGSRETTPNLTLDVLRLQEALNREGFVVAVDGRLGPETEQAVRAFQRAHGLDEDGIVGPCTWPALVPQRAEAHAQRFAGVPGLETFHGDLEWIHRLEGHVGRPYWPGGGAGVTLDPAFDLGSQPRDLVHQLYGDLLNAAELAEVDAVTGLRGEAAGSALAASPELKALRVTRRAAVNAMPFVAAGYWRPITGRFAVLAEPQTPGSVQTAFLSLAYNRGAASPDLAPLAPLLTAHEWLAAADAIGAMQQDHPLPGIRRRRREEADLIRGEMEIG